MAKKKKTAKRKVKKAKKKAKKKSLKHHAKELHAIGKRYTKHALGISVLHIKEQEKRSRSRLTESKKVLKN